VGYEAELWRMADALRGSMDAAEYKHVVLGLIFLKYISDAFAEMHAKLEAEQAQGADPEDPDEYRAQSIFWVPPEARWAHLKAQARQSTIGQLVDDAMAGIERDNPALKGVLPKDYARPALDKTRLGQLIDLISNIKVGDAEARAKDVLGRVYEYFLSQFASAEGKKGGEFYTPRCVVKLLVEMLEPYRGRVYDPCCGSSGMFVQSMEFIRAHATGNGNGGRARTDISIYGQESNYTTWRLAKMNLAIRGIDGQIAHGDTFHNDRRRSLGSPATASATSPMHPICSPSLALLSRPSVPAAIPANLLLGQVLAMRGGPQLGRAAASPRRSRRWFDAPAQMRTSRRVLTLSPQFGGDHRRPPAGRRVLCWVPSCLSHCRRQVSGPAPTSQTELHLSRL
jgi:hypothetical protein